MTKLRVYGQEKGNGSWARVSAGICEGLQAVDAFESLVATERIGHCLDESLPIGRAPIAVHVGPPSMASAMTGRGSHREKLVIIAANSSWLPVEMVQLVEQSATHFVAPSHWAANVMRAHTELPVLMWHHGVSEKFHRASLRHESSRIDTWRVLHMASTHMQRKGTAELIAAWADAHRDGNVKDALLVLAVDGPPGYYQQAIQEACRGSVDLKNSYRLWPRCDLTEDEAASLYKHCDIVCQPSRAEGFSMVPLEARVCGTPAIMTTCTGHADHWFAGNKKGVVTVATGDDAPIDDGPGALAPSLSVNAVTAALCTAYDKREQLIRDAESVSGEIFRLWSWERVCSDFLFGSVDRANGRILPR